MRTHKRLPEAAIPVGETFRVRFVIDDDARFEECNGKERPLSETEYAENQYMRDGTPIPYAEYLNYYGNPDRHVYLGCVVEKRCGCCGHWETAASLWSIDVMDDDPNLHTINLDQWYAADVATALPDYLGLVAREVLQEANPS